MNACLLNITNFLVTAYTSPVTLQVLGNVKSCLSIVVSVAIFGNALRPLQGLGVVICLVGVWLYQRHGGVIKTEVPKSIAMAIEVAAARQKRAMELQTTAEQEAGGELAGLGKPQ